MGMIVNPSRFAVAGGGVTGMFVGAKTGNYLGPGATTSLTDLLDTTGATATLLQDDIVIFTLVESGSTNIAQANLLPTDPSAVAYTAAHTDVYADDTSDTNLQVSYKFMGSTPDTSMNLPDRTSTNNGCAYHIMALRGVDKVTPLDVAATTASAQNTGVPNPPSITPATAGALISCHGGGAHASSATAFTRPAELSATTNHWMVVQHTGTAFWANLGVGIKEDWTSGAFDCSAYGGGVAALSASSAMATIAWRPA